MLISMKNHNIRGGLLLSFLTLSILFASILSINEIAAKRIEFRDISGEMLPTIPYNSTVLVDTSITKFDDLDVDDVIAYKTPQNNDGNKIVIHRITAIVMGDMALGGHAFSCTDIRGQNFSATVDQIVLFAKGDDNSCSLPGIDYPITDKEYIGKVVSITSTRNMN